MKDKKTHWKKLYNPNFLGSWSVPDKGELILTIKSIGLETHKFEKGREEEVIVIHWVEKGEDIKPFILNVTNSKTITKVYDSPYIEDWVGKKVAFYVDEKVKSNTGEVVGGLRIRMQKPKTELEVLSPDHNKWSNAVAALRSGNTTIEKIKLKYFISDEHKKVLIDDVVA